MIYEKKLKLNSPSIETKLSVLRLGNVGILRKSELDIKHYNTYLSYQQYNENYPRRKNRIIERIVEINIGESTFRLDITGHRGYNLIEELKKFYEDSILSGIIPCKGIKGNWETDIKDIQTLSVNDITNKFGHQDFYYILNKLEYMEKDSERETYISTLPIEMQKILKLIDEKFSNKFIQMLYMISDRIDKDIEWLQDKIDWADDKLEKYDKRVLL